MSKVLLKAATLNFVAVCISSLCTAAADQPGGEPSQPPSGVQEVELQSVGQQFKISLPPQIEGGEGKLLIRLRNNTGVPLSSLATVGSCSCIRPSISGTGQCGMNETVLVTIGLTATKGAFSQVATVTCNDDQSDARTNAASFLVEMKTFPPIHASAKVVALRQPETDRIRLVSAAPDLVTLGKEIELLSDFISIADIDVTDGEGLKAALLRKKL